LTVLKNKKEEEIKKAGHHFLLISGCSSLNSTALDCALLFYFVH
jgi:hypothetical protein